MRKYIFFYFTLRRFSSYSVAISIDDELFNEKNRGDIVYIFNIHHIFIHYQLIICCKNTYFSVFGNQSIKNKIITKNI